MAANNSNTRVVASSPTCSKCGVKHNCVHPYCLHCLQKMSVYGKNINCNLCRQDSKESTSKQPTPFEPYILDTSNIADHVLIEEEFVVNLTTKNHSSTDEHDRHLKITGSLTFTPLQGYEKEVTVKDHQDGTYALSGCCDKEGEWELRCYVNGKQISQTPLKVKVVKEGLQERPNIFRKKKDTSLHMFDIVDDTVYACGGVNEITKFTLEGKIIGTIFGHRLWQFTSLCCVNIEGDLLIVCYDKYMKRLMFYQNENWDEGDGGKIGSVYGKIMAHDDKIYVPDCWKNCVLCFSREGKLLDEIQGTGDYMNVKLSMPYGVAITKKGDILVLSYGCNQVAKINYKDKKAAVLIKNSPSGRPGPKLLNYTYAIAVDECDQIIIGCYRKLLLFNQDGIFIKNIDNENVPYYPYSIFCRNRCIWVADNKNSSLRFYYY
ncbi:uncharacterized protein LOC117121458 [Anneissia japonica]|uniref:uncharacterized protein LOC117121458 n=1 Tax=Anneissia japonica TaxID=1529436 RepID=UPI001425B80F|nr:uncharacterized protein LOC117121458 [Anneissia japonica]